MAAKSTKQGCPVMTTSSGRPVGDNQNSVTAGPRGPVLMEDYLLFEKMAAIKRLVFTPSYRIGLMGPMRPMRSTNPVYFTW